MTKKDIHIRERGVCVKRRAMCDVDTGDGWGASGVCFQLSSHQSLSAPRSTAEQSEQHHCAWLILYFNNG